MTKFISVLLGIAVLTSCQTTQRPAAPGQLFPGKVLNIRAPNSEGWKQLDSDSSREAKMFSRVVSINESYLAYVSLVQLPESKDRDEFVTLIRQTILEKHASKERLRSIEFNAEYTERRGDPCVRLKGVMDDTKARTAAGEQVLKLQTYTLVCRHPWRHQGRGSEGFLIEFSHRGPNLDPALDA